jgi:two-component system sensor kinase FixL
VEESLRLHSVTALGADLSHRLSQPLTAITYYCEILQQLMGAPAATAGADPASYLDRIMGQVQRAGQIIDDLRNLARLADASSGSVDIASTLEAAATLLRPRFAETGSSLVVCCDDPLPPVRGDSLQLVQVVHHLISNGYEAACEGGASAAVEVSARRTEDGVHVSVADNGPGVEHGCAHRVFDLFKTSKPGRLGFGLGISRSIVNAHGGRLWHEANPAGGAIFQFVLPGAG